MKVLVNCPGAWSHGLDSPERGEGRWAQNLVRCLAGSGRYDVYACSAGDPTWGRGRRVKGVKLLSEFDAPRYSPYDLYFDASWWEGKVPNVVAKHYFHVHWGFQQRLKQPLPSGHYLVYVYRQSREDYEHPDNANRARTFYLPAPFYARLLPPQPGRRRLLYTRRGEPDRSAMFEQLYAAVTALRTSMPSLAMTWISIPEAPVARHAQDRVLAGDGDRWGIPYCELQDEMLTSALNVSGNHASLADCAVLGVPSLAVSGLCWRFVEDIARRYGLLLAPDASSAQIYDVIYWLLTDAGGRYTQYTLDLQDAFSDHTELRVLELFDQLVASVT